MARPRTGYHLYQAYLLRLWRETPDSPLRASLQASGSDERHHFASLESLLVYLQSQAGEQSAPVLSRTEDAAGTKSPEGAERPVDLELRGEGIEPRAADRL